MKVSRILVKNFKSFEFMELDLQDFSVLVGQNGAGKSNTLLRKAKITADKDKALTIYQGMAL